MAWHTPSLMDARNSLIDDYVSGLFTISELSARHQISRVTVYKWIERFSQGGRPALEDASRRPKTSRWETSEEVQRLLIEARQAHPHWGPLKIKAWLAPRHPHLALPAPSTISAILGRAGLIARQPRRRPSLRPASVLHQTAQEPNDRWCVDFKGEFRLGNGQYCYPLTVTDEDSRYLLLCTALESTATEPVLTLFERLFQEHGLPQRIRSDNGVPFSSPTSTWGLSRLNIYWQRLGILHQPSRPAHPQDNGRHERMHRTLKQQTARPPAFDLVSQQQRFDAFVHQYNHERPHQALGLRTPGTLWFPSARRLPASLPEPDYPGHFVERRVASSGMISFGGQKIFLTQTLDGLTVGLEEVDDDLFSIWFYHRLLGRFYRATGLIR